MKITYARLEKEHMREFALSLPKLNSVATLSIPLNVRHFLWSDETIDNHRQVYLFAFHFVTLHSGNKAICLIIGPLFLAFAWTQPYDTFSKLYQERNHRILKMREQGVINEDTWTLPLKKLPKEVRKMERWYRRNHRRLTRQDRRKRDAKK